MGTAAKFFYDILLKLSGLVIFKSTREAQIAGYIIKSAISSPTYYEAWLLTRQGFLEFLRNFLPENGEFPPLKSAFP
jgi:hypothetical protein